MARLLALVPDLHYSGMHTQLLQLAGRISAHGHALKVVALGNSGPVAPRYAALHVPVHAVAAMSRWDLGALVQLRHCIRRSNPDVIHVFTLPCLRWLNLAVHRLECPVVLSRPFASMTGNTTIGAVDRWLVQRCRSVLVANPAQADRCRLAGINAGKIEVVPPAVDEVLSVDSGPSTHANSSGNPVVLCIGPLAVHKGFRDAIWAFDVLRHLHHDLRLWIVGAGPDLARLQHFVRILDIGHTVRFWGEQQDLNPLFASAHVVWVPSVADSGHHVALEALARGRPVVAAAVPGLAELIDAGRSGFLVSPGDKVGFVKKTRLLLEHADLWREVGQAGQERARTCQAESSSVAPYLQMIAHLAA